MKTIKYKGATYVESMLHKKDFNELAKILREEKAKENLCKRIAAFLLTQNPSFSVTKFLEAAGAKK